jgi:membrane protease YdiL (CAAX protease family)
MIPVIDDEYHPVGGSSDAAARHDPGDVAYPATESGPAGEQPPQPSTGWTYVDLLLFLLFAVPAQLAAITLCMGVFHLFEWVTGAENTFPDSLTEAPMVVAVQFVWWALLLGFIYGVVSIKHRLPFWPAIGWKSLDRPPAVYLLWGILLAFSVAALSHLLPMSSEKMPIEDLIRDRTSLAVLAIYGVLFAPALEELVFRGFLYKVVERSHGPLLAVLTTSVVFSLPHASQYGWHWQNLLLLTYVGIIFGTVRARTQSVVPSTLLHVGYNATLFAGLFAVGDKILGS